jgi:hypothetical protein
MAMKPLTKKQLRYLFVTIEINLILWFGVAGTVWGSSAELFVKLTTTAGVIVAALLQHWAYYNLYKRAAGK